MDNTILRYRAVVFALAVALALSVVVMLPRASSAAPPEPADQSSVAEGYCSFPVLFEQTGKVKEHPGELPGGVKLVTGHTPVTLTNLDNPENQLIDRGGGFAGRITQLENGDVLVVATGHNFLFDPGEGIFMTVGRAKFTVASGPDIGGDITVLESQGRLIDVCALLA